MFGMSEGARKTQPLTESLIAAETPGSDSEGLPDTLELLPILSFRTRDCTLAGKQVTTALRGVWMSDICE